MLIIGQCFFIVLRQAAHMAKTRKFIFLLICGICTKLVVRSFWGQSTVLHFILSCLETIKCLIFKAYPGHTIFFEGTVTNLCQSTCSWENLSFFINLAYKNVCLSENRFIFYIHIVKWIKKITKIKKVIKNWRVDVYRIFFLVIFSREITKCIKNRAPWSADNLQYNVVGWRDDGMIIPLYNSVRQ